MTDKAPHTTPQSRTLRIPKRWFVVAAILLFAAGCTEKSRNPLSPNIAGPIAGVSISVPALSSPLDGVLVSVDDQPVRVTFGNGQSNGERPVLYNVRLSTDAEFSVVLHEATEIPADPSGQTSYQLPAGLDPDQMYGCVATSGLRRQDGPPLASTVPGPPSCPATIRSNGVSSNPPSSSSAFGGTCGMP